MTELNKNGKPKGGPGRKGVTNNPNGRPKGVPNKIQLPLRKRIVEFLDRDFDGFIKELSKLDDKNKVKAKIEMMKLVIPRPVSQEELDAIYASGSPLLSRLFGKKSEVLND